MKKNILNIILLTLILISIFASLVYAETNEAGSKSQADDEYLTKGDAVQMISSTDLVQKRINDMLSWGKGYDMSKVNNVQLVPVIKELKAVPKKIPPDGRTIFDIKAIVDDPGGLRNISGVRADLTNIGKLPNAMLVDNGLWGDSKSNDGIYTLQTSVDPSTLGGEKEITVTAANKKGWMASARTTVLIDKPGGSASTTEAGPK